MAEAKRKDRGRRRRKRQGALQARKEHSEEELLAHIAKLKRQEEAARKNA